MRIIPGARKLYIEIHNNDSTYTQNNVKCICHVSIQTEYTLFGANMAYISNGVYTAFIQEVTS